MFKLTILKQDGSIYWVEHFNDINSANKWIAEEQTRRYWDKSYSFSITDSSPLAPSPEEKAAVIQKAIDNDILRGSIKSRVAAVNTLAEVKLLLNDIVKALL